MLSWIRSLIAYAMVLLVIATSGTLAVARGQTHIAGQMVLCIGATVATVNVDAEGNPVGPAHICPDCALSFIEDASYVAPQPTGPVTHGRIADVFEVYASAPVAWSFFDARAPPLNI